ncbi:MAG: 2-phospho-L-lactate transferase CofD family protein, partial [Candidatus Methylomirabilis sp.]|nr:2-phospho-L-lactate transferase CofD family protein [Deltaproteobacteria bacterium]
MRRDGDDAADDAVRVRVTHLRSVPDPLRLLRFEEAPELGPRVLFFSGGTALRKTARAIKRYTHNSIHLITPFDSGGSSAKLRAAFSMPAVGDIRNRLMALADESLRGNPEIYDLFAFRFPEEEDARALRARLDTMIERKDALVSRVPDPMRKIIRTHLRHFRDQMPEDFDLRGASVGNLILTGGYLNNERRLDPVIYMFSMLVKARGVVRPICNQHLHLAATLADGTQALGQHVLTARGAA